MRFTLASMASPGTDIAFNVARTEGYRAFANKIWNAARFIFMNVDKAVEAGLPPFNELDRKPLGEGERSAILASLDGVPEDAATQIRTVLEEPRPNIFESPSTPIETRWIAASLKLTAREVNTALENYRFDEAAKAIYQYFWGSFCDWYLEIVKIRLIF